MKKINLLFLFLLGALSLQAQDSEVYYHEGTITDQDGNPVADAHVCIYKPNLETGVNDLEYYGTSDAEGHYVVKVEEGFDNRDYTYNMSVECNGFPCYAVNYPFRLGDKYWSIYPVPKDITLWNKLVFTKDKRATIILPDAPDPSWGRYYRLDHFRTEDRITVFEREETPKANVPYVIFPNNDFSIDLSKYDFDNLPEPGVVPLFPDDSNESEFRSGFKGSYKNMEPLFLTFSLLDDTPDCIQTVDGYLLPRIGAFRAYLDGSRHFNAVFVGEAYLPFVEEGKQWHVVRSDFDAGNHLEQYMFTNEEVVKDGKTYMKMYRSEDDLTVIYDAGLLREENRKVYLYDADMQKEYLVFDYSLKAGDTYETYSYDEQKMMTYKVLSVGDYTEGPKVIGYVEGADSTTSQQRYLRKWIVCRADDETIQKTWIESVGSLEGPLANLYDERPISSRNYLAYVEYNENDNIYLPFSFNDEFGQIHGCDLPKGKAGNWDYFEDGWHHQLAYELEGDRLHVYGKALLMCGLNYYAYFIEEQTDDPLVHKLRFEMQGVGEPANCDDFYATDFYASGFDPNINYIVVDSFGEEHPVINKTPQMAYRPFVEEGKVWKVGALNSGNPVQWVEYFYFDGDTIIDGKTCLRMMNQRYINSDFAESNSISQDNSLSYVGAWYEENKQVYKYDSTNEQFKLMYDFSVDANDTLQIDNLSYVVGPKQTGGVEGFKGVYRAVRLWADGESIYSVPWLEGVGSTDAPITNVYPGYVDPAWFLMACVVNDEVIYLNDAFEDGATPEVMGARNRFDFTHTIKTKPQTPRRGMGMLATLPAEAEQSLYGEYNELLLDINLDPLDDAYLVRITDESGKAVYEKTINAGSIVGLNIDISNYAEGRYTVTVENNYESFVGEFDTQTTGISDAERLNDNERMINDIIYNLQGQRIKSLQKGLNIVNGRKIFVK